MAQRRVTLTFSGVNFAAILARWGSETAWKDWVKQQTFAAIAPPPATGYTDQFTERL